MKTREYWLILKRGGTGELLFARSYQARATKSATDMAMDAEAMDALADALKFEARMLRAESRAA